MRKHLLTLACAALLGAPATAGAITFADGLPHIIDATNSFPNDTIEVMDGPGSTTTTVTVVDGGEAGLLPLDGFGSPTRIGIDASQNSAVNVDGGEVSSVFLSDFAVATITGGRNICGLRMSGSSQATISGGDMGSKCFGPTIELQGDATLAITGGVIQRAFTASDSSVIDVTGGIFGVPDQGCVAEAGGNSTVTISGGDWRIGTPERCTFLASGNEGQITVVGTDFNFPLGDLPGGPPGILTGTLADGSPLDVVYASSDGGVITLVPEPTTALLLPCALAGLASAHRRRVE